jgi:hypothetical protein
MFEHVIDLKAVSFKLIFGSYTDPTPATVFAPVFRAG